MNHKLNNALILIDSVYDEIETGFVACASCGNQEDTKSLDFVSDIEEIRRLLISLTEPEMSQPKKFVALTKPRSGLRFWLGSVLIDVNMARTWVWCDDSDDGNYRHSRYFSLHKVEQSTHDNIAITLIMGPLKIMVGK